jgi:hypothetical protein
MLDRRAFVMPHNREQSFPNQEPFIVTVDIHELMKATDEFQPAG